MFKVVVEDITLIKSIYHCECSNFRICLRGSKEFESYTKTHKVISPIKDKNLQALLFVNSDIENPIFIVISTSLFVDGYCIIKDGVYMKQ
jgi:hypothetical protein